MTTSGAKSPQTECILDLLGRGLSVEEVSAELNVTRNLVRQVIIRNQPCPPKLAEKEAMLQRALDSVPRDPCGRCGTRGDQHGGITDHRWRPGA